MKSELMSKLDLYLVVMFTTVARGWIKWDQVPRLEIKENHQLQGYFKL